MPFTTPFPSKNTPTNREDEFWYVTLDDKGLIDMPSIVNYVLDKAGAKKLQILTHSQVRSYQVLVVLISAD